MIKKNLIEFEVISSTQIYLKNNLHILEDDSITIIRADFQTGGIGRNNKEWFSFPGGLWFSMAYFIEKDLENISALSQIIAYSICRYLKKKYNINPLIKWPNDIMVNDRKLCGILCDIVSYKGKKVLIIGIGLNTNFTNLKVFEIREGIKLITLLEILGKEVDNKKLLLDIVDQIIDDYKIMCKDGYKYFKEEIEKVNYLAHKNVEIKISSKNKKKGIVEGFDDNGYLVIKNKRNEKEIIYAGEVIIADKTK